jgi:predicted unusual protein kinase regulating ubiquinone biosynthesis (AarF/ABC1/UbiB family)
MLEQSDFRIEGNNLNSFKHNFDGLDEFVSFPEVFYQSEDLLIESYIDKS